MFKFSSYIFSRNFQPQFGSVSKNPRQKWMALKIRTTFMMLRCASSLEDSIEVKFSKSSGPGGQNVNKLSTKAEVRLKIAKANWMAADIKETLLDQQRNRITKRGELIVTSDRFRSQARNLGDAIEKLREMINKASSISDEPSKEKVGKILEYVEKENEKRLVDKKYHSEKKKSRTKL